MTVAAGGLLGVALFTAAGAGVVELTPGLRRLPVFCRVAYAYLLGVAWVGGALYGGSDLRLLRLDTPAILAVAAVPVAAALAAHLVRRRRSGEPLFGWRLRRLTPPQLGGSTPLAAAAAGLAGLISLAVFGDAVTHPLTDWDGRMTWATQAAYVRAERTVHPRALVEERWFVTHPRYPLLLPVAQAVVQDLARAGEDEQPFRVLYAAFYPVLLVLVYQGARRRAGRASAALAVLAVAPLFALTFASEGSAIGAYSDLPLACFWGAGMLVLLGPRPTAWDGVAGGLLLGAAALTKNEGALLAVFGLLLATCYQRPVAALRARSAGAHAGRRRRRFAAAGVASLLVVVALVLFASWRAGIPDRHDEDYLSLLAAAGFRSALSNLEGVVPVVLKRTFLAPGWLLFWWMVGAALVAAGRSGLRRRRAAVFACAAAAPPAIAWVAYAVHWNPVYLAGVTWDRVLIQALLPASVLLATALRHLFGPGHRPP